MIATKAARTSQQTARRRNAEESNVTELMGRVRALESRLAKLQRQNDRLREFACVDPLTGLANRRYFGDHLDKAFRLAGRYGGPIAVLMIDLDGMKRLNDTHGHPAGDAALCEVAEILRLAVRGSDTAARLGGDEFAVILPGTHTEGAQQVAERIRKRLADATWPKGCGITASIGVASADARAPQTSPSELIRAADRALYAAKRSGKNRIETRGLQEGIAA